MVFGTFDILHPGHQWFLHNASRFGDKLIAVVSRDSFVRNWKGKSALKDEETRIHELELSGMVDEAVLSDPEIRTYEIVKELQPDIICLGHDQKALLNDLKKWLLKTENNHIKIEILPPWQRKRYSSTRMNKSLRGAGNQNKSTDRLIFLLLIITMCFLGYSWISGKQISRSATPLSLSFLRLLITFLSFLPLILWNRKKITADKKHYISWIWTTAAALSLSAYNLFFFNGLISGLAGKGSLIMTTLIPLFTFMIIGISVKIRINRYTASAIALGIAGNLILIKPWIRSDDSAFLAAALCWSFLIIFSRKAMESLDFVVFNLRLYALAAFFLLPFVFIQNKGLVPAGLSVSFWLNMLFISIPAGTFGTGIFFIASSRFSTAQTGRFTYLIPIFTVIFSFLILGDKPDSIMLTGGFLAIISVIILYKNVSTHHHLQY